jgi:hypothetical protein
LLDVTLTKNYLALMHYLRIDETTHAGKNLLQTAQQLAKEYPSVVKLLTYEALEDKIWAHMIEQGLKSGLAIEEETQHVNKLLGLTDAL